jgi:hypothetical protein
LAQFQYKIGHAPLPLSRERNAGGLTQPPASIT